MQIKQEAQLHSYLKEHGVQGLYLLWGKEEYLIARWREKLIEPFAQQGGFNLQKFDGASPDFQEIYDATQQMPLMASQKCVVVDSVDPKKLTAAELKKLEQLLQDLPAECVLLLVFRKDALDAKSATGKKILALADKYGIAAELSPRDQKGVARFLQTEAATWGCTISETMCKKLVELCGNHLGVLSSELAKMCAYAGGGALDDRHLAVVVPQVEAQVFDLGKRILAGDSQKALEILENLLQLRESPVAITATLVMAFTDLYRVQVARRERLNVADAAKKFGYYGRECRLCNLQNIQMEPKLLLDALQILSRCDLALKSSSRDSSQILEQAVLMLLAQRATSR